MNSLSPDEGMTIIAKKFSGVNFLFRKCGPWVNSDERMGGGGRYKMQITNFLVF